MISKFDAWLTDDGEDDNAEEKISDCTNYYLTLQSYNPAFYSNFTDYIFDDCLAPKKEELYEALLDKDFARLGLLIYSQVYDYAHKRAERAAIEAYGNGELNDER